MKRFMAVVLILFLAFELTGCETIQRKFTRKTKKKSIRPRFYTEGLYETRPALELYMMHYTYWKSWHEDLVTSAGRNSKRDAMAITNALSHLNDMKRYLLEEKAEELNKYIVQTKSITDRISKGGSEMNLGNYKQRLDTIKTRIIRNFYYKKVREYIKEDR
ncbi:MAG: hypothetical protein V3S04_01590 [Candidatus Omnitrophota bacterium]